MALKEGFYWVKKRRTSTWIVAESTGNTWWLTGEDAGYNTDDFYLIGDRIEEPTEDGS
jgi:hypothetical protein